MAKKIIKSVGKKAKTIKKSTAKKAVKQVRTIPSKKTKSNKSKPASSKITSKNSIFKNKKNSSSKKIAVKNKIKNSKPAAKAKIETKKKASIKPVHALPKSNSSRSKEKTSNTNNNPVKNKINVSSRTNPTSKPNKAQKKTSITNDVPAKLPANAFELEYVVHASAELLFTFLTEPSGLSEWFCDDVNIRNGIYTFFWDGTQQQAKEIKVIQDKVLRLQWIEKSNDTYFEYRIEKDDLTSDISLIITDFADSQEEKQSSILLWNSQIDKLLHVMGAYF